MQITKTTLADVVILSVEGRLDATTAPAFESGVQAELQSGAKRLVIDLGQVQLISSAALRVLVSAAKQMKKQEGQILLCAMTPEVAKVFGISGLASLFNLQPTREEALTVLGVSMAESAPPPVESAPAPLPAEVPPSEPVAVQPAEVPPPEPVAVQPAPPAPEPIVKRTLPPPPPMIAPPPSERTLPPPPVRLPPPSARALPPPAPKGRQTVIFAAVGAAILLVVLLGFVASGNSPKRGRAAQASSAPHSKETARASARDATPPPAAVPDEVTSTPAPLATTQGGEPPQAPAGEAENVQPSRTLNFDGREAENQETRRAVLQRIAAMSMSPAQRDRLSEAVDHARGMAKIITINFAAGHTELGAAAVGQLKQALQRPDIQKVLNDPSAVFIVLGFADPKGSPQVNKETSQRRADRTLAALRGPCGLGNVMHALGMGGSEIVDQAHAEKNRAVEVWAVQP